MDRPSQLSYTSPVPDLQKTCKNSARTRAVYSFPDHLLSVLLRSLDFVTSTPEDNVTFTTLCFVFRILTAIGSAASITAGFAYVATTFPDNLSIVVGILESAVGLGLMIGPAFGGIVYEVGSLTLTFR